MNRQRLHLTRLNLRSRLTWTRYGRFELTGSGCTLIYDSRSLAGYRFYRLED